MKCFSFIILFFVSLNSFAAKAPNQEVVDYYINLANQLDVKSLQGIKSDWKCSFELIHDDPNFFARSKTPEEAVQRLQLICIKSQCQRLGEIVQSAMDKVASMPEQEYRDYLEFSGFSQTEIENALLKRNNVPKIQKLTCDNASPLLRTIAFDTCFTVPVQCQKE